MVLKGLGVAMVLLALGLVGGGVWQWHLETTGERVSATVKECHHVDGLSGGHTSCTGSWVEGGSPLGDGHVVTGTINGVGKSDIGGNVTVRAHGDSSYTPSHTPAIFFSALGLVMLVDCGVFVWAIKTGRARGGSRVSRQLAKKYIHVRR